MKEFELKISEGKRGWKTRVVDQSDKDEHPVYLMSPGSEREKHEARRKWESFAWWIVSQKIAAVPEQVQSMLPPEPAPEPTPEQPAEPEPAIKVEHTVTVFIVVSCVLALGVVIGYFLGGGG